AYVTLHVGPGTFRPVQANSLDDHEMHEEAYEVPEATVTAIGRARAEGRPVVAVGTTVVRTLESSIDADGTPVAGVGTTRLFIRPPHRFEVVDHLLTNFHLPRSTLLALVMAFAGGDLTRRAYREAADRRYRFYSYGDAMLIRRGTR
ncbi:MAG: S-adenosylmethionine:tRNA ribosyltransferase-isomerase, partial [Polyangiales bacterium]